MSEQIKTEGSFKMPAKKPSVRKLNKTEEPIKVSMKKDATVELPAEEITKVVIAAEPVEPVIEGIVVDPVVTMVEITNDNTIVIEEPPVVIPEPIIVEKQRTLPDNIEKLIAFMEETGGDINDYSRLNTDYSGVNGEVLLREYYKKSRPHLDNEEIQFLMEDKFSFDEEEDDERDIRKKKLEFKEEVAKAKNFLEDLKGKYYDEIKLRPSSNPEQQKANDFFNRFKQDQQNAELQHVKFKEETNNLFQNDFKGFDFNVGEKSFRYSVPNANNVADKQSNINTLLKKFLNEKGEVADVKGYHKAIYSADNSDNIAKHFYEQGKADAIKDLMQKSNNTTDSVRQAAPIGEFVNGIKVRVLGNDDATRLSIKNKKF